jgi:hypothetical protein
MHHVLMQQPRRYQLAGVCATLASCFEQPLPALLLSYYKYLLQGGIILGHC